jgi:hypothetical protein
MSSQGRIEQVLDELAATAPPEVVARVQELLRAVLALHRDGLARMLDGIEHAALVDLVDDPAVDTLLVLHDLHPFDLATRASHLVRRLSEQTPGLDLQLSGVETDGTVHLRVVDPAGASAPAPTGLRDRVLAALPDAVDVVVEPE